ncbi:MAG: hypothetical protein QM680_13410 [Luteolibacter sp.]
MSADFPIRCRVRSYAAGYYNLQGTVMGHQTTRPSDRWVEFDNGDAAYVPTADLELIEESPMSTDTLTKPDEVLAAPGAAEAAAIREDYDKSVKGLHAFVRMGFRLIDVKSRLPHGQYMAWCKRHLSDLGKSHLHRSRQVAEGMLKMTDAKFPPRGTFELPAEISEIIDGASGYRALLGEIEEFRHDELEAKNKELCEAAWKNELLRDEWEPRVLSGEITYTQAIRGMTGQEISAGQKRGEDNVPGLLKRNLASLPNCWKQWDKLNDSTKMQALEQVPQIVTGAPRVVLEKMQAAIAEALAN